MENSKSETRNPKQIQMTEAQNSKRFCLEIWIFEFVSRFDIRISDLVQGDRSELKKVDLKAVFC